MAYAVTQCSVVGVFEYCLSHIPFKGARRGIIKDLVSLLNHPLLHLCFALMCIVLCAAEHKWL